MFKNKIPYLIAFAIGVFLLETIMLFSYVRMVHNCSKFWGGEKCVMVAVPTTIEYSFSDEYYKLSKKISP